MLEFRYANMLTVLAVTFLYSGGMPILYPIAALYFFVAYWMDKCLLFCCYRKPIQFDSYLARSSVALYKYILILHILGFILMFGLTPILPTDFSQQTGPDNIRFQTPQGEFTLYGLYFWLMFFILLAFILWKLPVGALRNCIRSCCFKRIKEKVLAQDEVAFENDFYQCASFTALKEKLAQT